jgi:cytoskeletal protein CcmA (bactofilin family)
VGVGGTVVGDVRGQTITIKGAVRGNINGSVKMMTTADSANDASALPSQAGSAITAEAVEKLLGVLNSRMR